MSLEQEIADVQAQGYTPLTDDELERMYQSLGVFTWWRDAEPTPVDRCWECDQYVLAEQRLRAVALYQAIICAICEPWVRKVLHGMPERRQS